MMTMRSLIVLFFLLGFDLGFANDTSAELAAGGLVFVKNPFIQMKKEDLYLSQHRIKVRYVFFNPTDKAIQVRIAFPLPDIESLRSEAPPPALPVDAPSNPIRFKTTVNQKPITMSVHQQAMVKNKEITSLLKPFHIPLSPRYSKTPQALKRIPRDKWSEFEALGVMGFDGDRDNPQPGWTLKTVYSWVQTFPAKQSMVIEHEYHPVLGGAVVTTLANPYRMHTKSYQKFIKKYCVSPSLQKRVAASKIGDMPAYSEATVAYILKTGANWAGPIDTFTLTVDKGDRANLVSFCPDTCTPITPTQCQIKKTHFIPKQDLFVLFLIPQHPQKGSLS